MRYASLCDGIGAVHAAWQPLGWTCVWTSEIEPFLIAVVEHYWKLPNLCDMTKIDRKEAVKQYGRIDLLVGGTPCQDFSTAGRGTGWEGRRGCLTAHFVRLVRELRPHWFVFENVPGILRPKFRRGLFRFLSAFDQVGYSLAWRVLNAQFFGVPQRRRRFFLVGHLGDWTFPASVLLESESLRGNSAPRQEAGQDIVGTLTNRTKGGGFPGTDEACGGYCRPVSRALTACKTQTLEATQTRGNRGHGILTPYGVRRLTPLECERLMGFCDGYTATAFRGKPAADGPRYQALGNSMAVPVMRWIGERIELCERNVR